MPASHLCTGKTSNFGGHSCINVVTVHYMSTVLPNFLHVS